jgi:cation diffusion facilitator CzcD-associated flavoprotein CzcO
VNEAHVHEVVIVGAGFGGLGMAIRLKQEGIEDFVLLERGDDVGGTWWANSYPGCQCDIPSNLYSFSFARYDWDRAYPMRNQILEYLRDCAQRFDVLRHTRLGCELLGATWLADEQRWELETSDGRLAARVLVAAPGLLSEPSTPALPGLERFEGSAFHTANWDHRDDLRGKRVALLGSGATAVQVVPNIQPRLAKLYLFQRTPPWVVPHFDHPVRPRLRALYRRAPAFQCLSRGVIYSLRETFVPGITRDQRFLALQGAVARMHLRRQVPDPELRRRLTPDYHIFCKRIILSNDWYPAIQAPNVDIVSSGVREVRERSVVDNDGIEREIDTLIFATGFRPAELPLLRPEPEPRTQLDRLHAGVADELRARRAAHHAHARRGGVRGARRGAGRVQRGDPGAAGANRLEHRRMRELVLRRQRPQLNPVARLHLRVPPPHAPLRRGGLPAGAQAGARNGCGARCLVVMSLP